MEPRIRYAPTADGVSIAFWTLGEGKPLVYMAGGPWGHVELWDIPECRRWYERLAQKRMLVRYDVRGTGGRSATYLTARLMLWWPTWRPWWIAWAWTGSRYSAPSTQGR